MADGNKMLLPMDLAQSVDGLQISKVWCTRISWAIILYGLVVYLYHLIMHAVTDTERGMVMLLMVFNSVSVAATSFVRLKKPILSLCPGMDQETWWSTTLTIHVWLLYFQHALFFGHPRNPHYMFWFAVVGTPLVVASVAVNGCTFYNVVQCLRTFGIACMQTPLLVIDVTIGYILLCVNYICWYHGYLGIWSCTLLYCSLYGLCVYLHVAVYSTLHDNRVDIYIVSYVFIQGGHAFFVAFVIVVFCDLNRVTFEVFISWMFVDKYFVILAVSVALFCPPFIFNVLRFLCRLPKRVWASLDYIDVEATLENALMV